MASVSQVIDRSFEYFSSERIQSLKVWNKAVDTVTQLDYSVLAYQLMREHDRTKAQRAVDYFKDCIDRAREIGMDAPLLRRPVLKEPVMVLSELEGWLKKMTIPRRRCFLYALASEQNLTEVMEMTWKEYAKQCRKVPEYCQNIVRMQPRHIHSDLVFYELHNNKPLALSGLEFESLMITGKPWVELLEDSQNIIIDNSDELSDLIKY